MKWTLVISVALLINAVGCSSEQKPADKPTAKPAPPAAKPDESVGEKGAPAPQPATQPAVVIPAPAASSNRVLIETSQGNIVVELTPDRTPITVENFLRYVDDKFYDGTIFHRVIQNFMIQGGGFTADLQEKPTLPPIKNESDKAISNMRGTIAMARRPDPNSATAQFFINTVDNQRLNFPSMGGYTAFGRVVEGMDVVDKIAASPKENRGGAFTDMPVPIVTINSVRRL